MRYLSLYKTLTDHNTDASNRSNPNISLIIDEKKLILTNENNNDTTFNNVNIIETFDKIPTTPDFTTEPPYNIFPTDTSTRIPVVKIYTDSSDAYNQINKDFYDNAQIWRNNYILNTNPNNPSQAIIVWPDKLYIDENICPTIYYLDIYSDRIMIKNWDDQSEVLTIHPDGSVFIISYIPANPNPPANVTTTPNPPANTSFNIFPPISPTQTSGVIPSLIIYTDNTDLSKSKNMEIYNEANQWKYTYYRTHGFVPNRLSINELIIDGKHMYDYIDFIFGEPSMILEFLGQEALLINGDGSVTVINSSIIPS